MLSSYDYVMILFYFVFTASLGMIFKRFCLGSKDFFAGGLKMNWWLLGASSFISNFSAWTFTGAAGMAYSFGVIFFAIYIIDILGFIIAIIWFAPRFRRLRLITAMDSVRLRFGRVNEQVFTWLQMLAAFVGGAVWLVGLSIILSAAFQLPQVPVIMVCGATILFMTLLGGNWAVVASDFIQSLLLMLYSVVVAVLTIRYVGGVDLFVRQIPETHWQMFQPLGSSRYDWLYVVSSLLWGLYQKNSILFGAAKYIAAKDDRHARKSAFIPLIGYILLPLFWFIPAIGAHMIVPDLMDRYAMFTVPGEASYIAVCLAVLPQGLLGLMVAGLFAATMSSMDTSFNKSAGFLIKNVYQPLLRPDASDGELLLAGRIGTLLSGVTTIYIAILIVTRGQVSLFDAYLYLNAYIQAPLTVVLFLGLFIRKTPAWSGWCTVIFGTSVSVFIFDVIPTEAMRRLLEPWMGVTVYQYLISNKFTFTSLITVPLTSLFFWATRRFYIETDSNQLYVEGIREFTARMRTPVDFEAEVGDDNTPRQARVMGLLACVYGIFLCGAVGIPNPKEGRLSILFCAVAVLAVGAVLLSYARRKDMEKTTTSVSDI